MKKKSYKCYNQKGFTLVELLAVVAVAIIIIATVYSLSIFGYRQQFFMLEQNEALEEAKRGIEIMVQEIREASDGDNGGYPLIQADDFTFIFFSNIDTDDATERVRYFLEDEQLKKGIVKPDGQPLSYKLNTEQISTVSSDVINETRGKPIFRYYNSDYPGDTVNNPLSTPADLQSVGLVEVRLAVNVNPEKAPGDEEIVSFVQLRNLSDY